jgi:hypothetical protein
MPGFIDISGRKFNHLKVIKKRQKRNKFGVIVWECICDCGNTYYAKAYELKHGLTSHCGCKTKKHK